MKDFTTFLSESGQQLDEATTRGRATLTVKDNQPYEMQGTLVHKTDGYQPNIELVLKYHKDKQNGKLAFSMDTSKGSFEDKRYIKKFNKTLVDLVEMCDELETLLMTGRTKKVEALMKRVGFSLQVAS